MSDETHLLPSSRAALADDLPDPRRTLDTLATVMIVILTVGILFFAREILVPIAIAVLLSFVLSPLVKALRKLGLGKRLSVGAVVFATFLIAVGAGAILAKQISDLAADAPKYQTTVMSKIDGFRTFAARSPVLGKLNSVIAEVTQSPRTAQKAADMPRPAGAPLTQDAPKTGPLPVELVSPPPGVLTILQAAIGMAASPLATAAVVAIFIVFILMQREDLRNRFIRLVGSGDLQRTTLAMNDAARRLSRYFLAQVCLNMGFGAAVAAALTILGVPSALLWGIVAAFMRFIPYVGSIGAAFFPVVLAAAANSGWTLAFETAAFFVAIELIVGQVVEPLVYGHHTGISPIAVVISATFWTWLWGPVGLVLSTPMTVCLVVMGRHVGRLAFLDVLLGDAPALTQVEIFYQRMLAGDPSEILDHAEGFMREHSLLEYSDQIAMKALLTAQVDVRRGTLDDARQLRIRDMMRDLAEDFRDRDDDHVLPGPDKNAPASLAEPTDHADAETRMPQTMIDPSWMRSKSIICFAGRTPLDEAAAHLLADVLMERGIGVQVEPADSLMRKGTNSFDGDTRLVILSFLDADLSITQAKVAVRRLRRRIPNVAVMAAFWMSETDDQRAATLCESVRCDVCASSLPQALSLCLQRAAPSLVADAA